MVAILAQHEKGQKVTNICREHGISHPTFYQWQRKYSGMEVNDLKKMKEMEFLAAWCAMRTRSK